MKTDEEIKTDIYRYIMTTELPKNINGIVKKTKRPLNSDKEDVVISILNNINGQIQTATLNVNIYVQDDRVQNQEEEATGRCTILCKIAEHSLNVIHGKDYSAHLLSQRVLDSGNGEHIISNQIEYKTLNEKI